MFLKLRVICTIISAICIGLALPAWALFGPIWLAILGLGALLFFLLMRVFKDCQEKQEAKNAEQPPSFLDPAQKTDTQTERKD